MGKRSPLTAKARKLSMLEAKRVQAVGDAADYERGRFVRAYDSFSSRAEIDAYEDYVAEKKMLTPCEQMCIAMGLAENPYKKRRMAKYRTTSGPTAKDRIVAELLGRA